MTFVRIFVVGLEGRVKLTSVHEQLPECFPGVAAKNSSVVHAVIKQQKDVATVPSLPVLPLERQHLVYRRWVEVVVDPRRREERAQTFTGLFGWAHRNAEIQFVFDMVHQIPHQR